VSRDVETVAARAVAAIATGTFATSFYSLTSLAISEGHMPLALAVTIPLAVDGLVLACSMVVMAARRHNRPAGFSWLLIGLFTLLSVAGNTAHAWEHGPIAVAIHAVPPIALFLSFEQLLSLRAHTRHPDIDSGATGARTGATPAATAATAPGAPAEAVGPADTAAAALPAPRHHTASHPGDGETPAGADDADAPRGAARTARDARSARARVRAALDDHAAAGGDPDELTGVQVAQAAGCSVRRAQELLADLRAAQPTPAVAAGNGHHTPGGTP